jgi:probable F420-dependent oxidoreductase
MRHGLVFPHADSGFDEGVAASRAFCRAAEDAGFDYLAVPDHVAGVDTADRPGFRGPYDARHPFREVFVHLGYLAAVTRIELMPCVLVLPQRPAVLVAKQAAELDVLTEGRLRLGLGGGWSAVESRALGADFAPRGERFDEQIEVMQALWAEPVVMFEGRFHRLDRVGIAPRPPRPIPLWIGGGPSNVAPVTAPRVYRRIGRFAQGWVSSPTLPAPVVAKTFATIARAAERAGRDPSALGLQASVRLRPGGSALFDADAARRRYAELRSIGVTHVTFESRKLGYEPQQHVDLIGELGGLIAAL